MLLLIIQCTILFIIAYAAWSWLRALGTRAGLKNIPGPPSESFIIGLVFHLWSVLAGRTYPIPREHKAILRPRWVGFSQTACRELWQRRQDLRPLRCKEIAIFQSVQNFRRYPCVGI